MGQAGFFCCRLSSYSALVSLVVAFRLLSCGIQAYLLCVACGILVPQPGIELVSPALQGRFLITGPLGKSLKLVFM